MTYKFKKSNESARNDKYTMELYLFGKITKRTAKRMIEKNNGGEPISDEDFNALFNLGWYDEAIDQGKTAWLKSENLYKV